MSPITHFIGSWLIASTVSNNPRDRRLITLAGVIPDADGMGIVIDFAKNLTSHHEPTFPYYQQYHHVLFHGWPGALFVALIFASLARQRWRVFAFCLITFHLHLLCDLIGSRGPTAGDLWPICYSEPIFRHPIWFWKHQWRLDGWENQTIFVAVFACSIWLALKRGFSFVEVINKRADVVFMGVLRNWRDRLCTPKTKQSE